MSLAPTFTLIIPAHNESGVIARCLETVMRDAPRPLPFQIIVAANGCTDNTVEIAREIAPEAVVLDLPKGSKTAAMNQAHLHAKQFPRIYLDADIRCDFASLVALAELLKTPGVFAASPKLRMDLSRSDWMVRSYYKVWVTQPYVTDNMVGSGCYGISKAGAERIGDFPPITGDDIWVHSRFRDGERRSIGKSKDGSDVFFTVSPPRKIIDQIRIDTRRRLGNEEVLRQYPSSHFSSSNSLADLSGALSKGANLSDIVVYVSIKALSRLRATWAKIRKKGIVWERDLSARDLESP